MSRILASPQAPKVKAPSLKDFKLVLPESVPSSTAAQLVGIFKDLQLSGAERFPREAGEVVQPTDEVVVDVVGFLDERIVPFSAREDLTLGPGNDGMLPGLRATLDGIPVDATENIPFEIPQTHPIHSFRGKLARFVVRVKASADLVIPDPNSSDFLASLELGEDFDQVFDELAKVDAENRLQALRYEAVMSALRQLSEKTGVKIPDSVIDHEIGRQWIEVEGHFLSRIGVPQEQREIALQAWLDNPELRADVANRSAITLTVGAIAAKEKLVIDQTMIDEYLKDLCESEGLEVEMVSASLAKEGPSKRREMTETLAYLRAVDFIVERIST